MGTSGRCTTRLRLCCTLTILTCGLADAARPARRRTDSQPSVYLDGVPLRIDAFDAVNLSHPSSVEGLEIHVGLGSLPAEYVDPNSVVCGAIGVWTRRGPPGDAR